MPNTYSLQQIGQFFIEDSSQLSVKTAYNEVGFFRRAIDIRRNGVANMPFDLRRGTTEIVNENTLPETELDLVLDIFSLIPQFATDLDLYGAAYAIFLSDELGIAGQGWVRLHPKRVIPIPGSDGTITSWQITAKNKTYTIPAEARYFLWLWQDNYTDANIHLNPGQPLAKAALVAAGVLHYSGRFQSAFFERGAITPTLVSVEGFNKLAKTARDEIRSKLRRLMGGSGNAHQIHPVDGKTTVSTLQSPLRDMALVELSKEQKETIAVVTGVPLSLLMSNAANYATATQDDFNFYDKAIAPFLREIIAPQLNKRLFNPLGYSLAYVPTRLDAYQAIELQKSVTLNGMLDRNVISINEYRQSMGMEIIEETPTPEPEPEPEPEIMQELKRWQTMSVKRYIEGKPEKALHFKTDIIPDYLVDRIKSSLATVETVDSVKMIFKDARLYGVE